MHGAPPMHSYSWAGLRSIVRIIVILLVTVILIGIAIVIVIVGQVCVP